MEKTSSSERLVPSLLVYDMGETLAFYRKLGFEVTGCDGAETSSTWAEVSRGRVTFSFIPNLRVEHPRLRFAVVRSMFSPTE